MLKKLLKRSLIPTLSFLLILEGEKFEATHTLAPLTQMKHATKNNLSNFWEKTASKYPSHFSKNEIRNRAEALKKSLSFLNPYLKNILSLKTEEDIKAIYVTGKYITALSRYAPTELDFIVVLKNSKKLRNKAKQLKNKLSSIDLLPDQFLDLDNWGYTSIYAMNFHLIFESDFWKKSNLIHAQAFYASCLLQGKHPWKKEPAETLFYKHLLPHLCQEYANQDVTSYTIQNQVPVLSILMKGLPLPASQTSIESSL